MRKVAAVVALFPFLLPPAAVGPALADLPDDAEVAYLRCDYETAYRLYRELAGRGDAFACTRLGEIHYFGRGVPRDYVEAMRWYRKAADRGDPSAQYAVGLMHTMGQGVPQDYTEAAAWYDKAAGQGHAEAQNNLALMYFMGEGVPYNFVLAHMWYDIAASLAPEGQKRELAAMNRDHVAKYMAAAEVAEARRLAEEWRSRRERKAD